MNTKRCTHCYTARPVDQFYEETTKADGLSQRCYYCPAPYRLKSQAEWRKNNPDKIRENAHAQEAKRRGVVGDDKLPRGYWNVMLAHYGEKCLYPGCEKTETLEFDHVVPLLPRSKGGRHTLANAQILCKHHNTSKGNRHSTDYRDHRKGILVGLNGLEPIILYTLPVLKLEI